MFDVVGFGVGVAGIGLYLHQRYTGCTGGHVWGEWEPTNRWEVQPANGSDSACIDREYERTCQRDGCSASETEYHGETHAVYAESVEEMVDTLPEVCYECPLCHEDVPISERDTSWHRTRDGRTRYEGCPRCEQSYPSEMWNRVPYEVVSQ